MQRPESLIELLLLRLERLSADSPVAHRASGLRGSLLKSLEDQQRGNSIDRAQLDRSIEAALAILTEAAAAVPLGRRSQP